MICKYELRFASIMNDLEDLMHNIIDDIIKRDGDLDAKDTELHDLLDIVTETYTVHEKDLQIGE